MGNPVKGLIDCQMDDTNILFLVHCCSQSITEGHQIDEAGLALGGHAGVLNHLPAFHVP